jgi:hypothetical protein
VAHDYSPITTAVAKSGGVKTFEMVELLTAHGAGKLGRIVRKEISADLARMGYGHVPADLPNRKVKLVRVFKWWEDSKTAIGQSASEMFLWHLIGRYRAKVDDLLADQRALANLKIRFRGNTDGALDIVCAQFKQEDLDPDKPRLFPTLTELQTTAFPEFARWWSDIRMECGPSASVAKHRSIALLIPAFEKVFGTSSPSDTQWSVIALFLKATRETAKKVLGVVDFPESKGKWTSQRKQLEAFDEVARKIVNL